VSKVEDVLPDGVKAGNIQPHRRQHGPTVLLTDPNDDIASTQVVEIVGIGAQGMERVERIPAGLEFETLPLDGCALQKIVDVQRQRHGLLRQQNIHAK